MRELILRMSISLDGFVGGLEGSGNWMMYGGDPTSKAAGVERVWDAGLHIMGSRTFRDMVAFWPTSTDAFAPPMNQIPKVVFSRQGPAFLQGLPALPAQLQLDAESWANAQVASGDLAGEIARLKAEDGKPILAHGGVGFARNLVAAGLVDQFLLVVRPVALGKGQALFCDLAAPMPLKLVSSTAYPGGVVSQTYRPA